MSTGTWTAKLVQEAMVLAFVDGAYWALCSSWKGGKDGYPRDTAVMVNVLISARTKPDLYPTLAEFATEVLDGIVDKGGSLINKESP